MESNVILAEGYPCFEWT